MELTRRYFFKIFTRIIFQADFQGLFKSPYKWLIFTKKSENIFQNYKILPDSNVNLIIRDENNFQLNSIYKIEENSSLIVQNLNWNKTNGRFKKYRVLSKERQNLLGKGLIVSVVLTDNDSYSHLYDYRYFRYMVPVS